MGLVRCVPSGMDAGSALECVHFAAGVIRQYQFAGNVQTIAVSFFASVGFESKAVFNDCGQGRKVWNAGNLNSQRSRDAGKVSQLPWVGCSDQNAFYHELTGMVSLKLFKLC